jgi:hypothetical protein
MPWCRQPLQQVQNYGQGWPVGVSAYTSTVCVRPLNIPVQFTLYRLHLWVWLLVRWVHNWVSVQLGYLFSITLGLIPVAYSGQMFLHYIYDFSCWQNHHSNNCVIALSSWITQALSIGMDWAWKASCILSWFCGQMALTWLGDSYVGSVTAN